MSAKSTPASLVRITLPPIGGDVKSVCGYFQTSWNICCSARKKEPLPCPELQGGLGGLGGVKVHGFCGIT